MTLLSAPPARAGLRGFASGSTAEPSGVRVLIVEDSAVTRLALADAIGLEGMSVEVAANVREARAKLRAGSFSVVLSDHKLPDGTGLDLYAWLRRSELHPTFLLTTGYQLEHLLLQVTGTRALTVLAGDVPAAEIAEAVIAKGAGAVVVVAGASAALLERVPKELGARGVTCSRLGSNGGHPADRREERSLPEVALFEARDVLVGRLAELAELRASSPSTSVVLALNVSSDARARLFDLNSYSDCMVKPIDPPKIVARLERALWSAQSG